MDLAVPVKAYPNQSEPAWLRYALRSIWHHMDYIDRVFIVGFLPAFIDPDEVTYIPTIQDADKFTNTERNLRAVLESDISEDFIWTNDDIFALREVPDPLPMFSWRSIAERVGNLTRANRQEHNDFVDGMRAQLELALKWGYPEDTPNTDLHVPIPVNKTRLKHLLDRRDAEAPGLKQWRMLYGLGLDTIEIEDRKVRAQGLPDVSDLFCSTSPASWRNRAGDYLRNRYWRPSEWETE